MGVRNKNIDKSIKIAVDEVKPECRYIEPKSADCRSNDAPALFGTGVFSSKNESSLNKDLKNDALELAY